jgi:hypothetical protein
MKVLVQVKGRSSQFSSQDIPLLQRAKTMEFAAEPLTSYNLLKPDYCSSCRSGDKESPQHYYYLHIMRGICKDIPTEKKNNTRGSSKKLHQHTNQSRPNVIDNSSDDDEDQQETKKEERKFRVAEDAHQVLKNFESGDFGLQPTANDVLCGRGAAAIRQHSGNIVYKQLVEANKPLYKSCEQYVKPLIAKSIVAALSLRGGRFLKQTAQGECWVDIGADAAVSKTLMRLRRKNQSKLYFRK